jgi:hypothetical protein
MTAQRLENAQSVCFSEYFRKIDAFYAARAPCAVRMTAFRQNLMQKTGYRTIYYIYLIEIE